MAVEVLDERRAGSSVRDDNGEEIMGEATDRGVRGLFATFSQQFLLELSFIVRVAGFQRSATVHYDGRGGVK